jgi:hypothetical protein
MKEVCYCGRTGEIEDREPIVIGGDGKEALRCPQCGSVDHLHWLSDGARRLVLEEAGRRTRSGQSPRRRRHSTSRCESLAPRSRDEAGGGRGGEVNRGDRSQGDGGPHLMSVSPSEIGA